MRVFRKRKIVFGHGHVLINVKRVNNGVSIRFHPHKDAKGKFDPVEFVLLDNMNSAFEDHISLALQIIQAANNLKIAKENYDTILAVGD